MSESNPPSSAGARATPSALTTLADVATFLQAGIGSEEGLSGVVGALQRDLDLEDCCIWLKDSAGTGYRPIVAAGAEVPGDARSEAVSAWMEDQSLWDSADDLHIPSSSVRHRPHVPGRHHRSGYGGLEGLWDYLILSKIGEIGTRRLKSKAFGSAR